MRKAKSPDKLSSHNLQAARATNEDSPEKNPPVFCLRYMRNGFSLAECDKIDQAAFAMTLYKLSKLSWAEIRNSQRHGLGSEKLNLASITGDSTDHLFQDSVLIAIRFSGRKSMVGYRDGSVFHIVWLDTKLELYDHT